VKWFADSCLQCEQCRKGLEQSSLLLSISAARDDPTLIRINNLQVVLIGRIDGRFGTVEFMPIHFMHKSPAFDELCALYAVSGVCLVTSTRDGMNLVTRSSVNFTARPGHRVQSEVSFPPLFYSPAHSLSATARQR
jgi:trehalose-6-phosphate synthase